MQLNIRKQMHGDTIIEVLMSVAIAGVIIAGAYALSNRSLAEGISASEHNQAIKLAEEQIEILKSRQKDAASNQTAWDTNYGDMTFPVPANKDNYCVNTGVTTMYSAPGVVANNWKPQNNGGGSASFNGTNLVAGSGSNDYLAVCTDTGNAATAKYFKNIKVTTYNGVNRKPTYLVTVRWNPVNGGPYNQSQIYYRF